MRRRFSRHDCSVQRDWCLSMDAGRLPSRKNRNRALQRCHSTREISVASVFLQKRCDNGRQRSSADFGSPRTISHQIMGHGRHALKNLDPGVGARFRRVNPFSLLAIRKNSCDFSLRCQVGGVELGCIGALGDALRADSIHYNQGHEPL